MSFIFSLNFWLAVIFSLIPGLVWLNFYLKEDTHPEPKKWLFLVFTLAALATFLAGWLEKFFPTLFGSNSFREIFDSGLIAKIFLFFILVALLEEIVKYLVVRLTVAFNKKIFNEPIDAMIYMIVSALGFATMENIFYSLNLASLSLTFFIILFFRFIGATFMHSLASAFVGYSWAWSEIRKRNADLIRGFVAAVLLHAFYNFLIIENIIFFAFLIFVLFTVAVVVLREFEIIKIKEIKKNYGQ